MVLSEWRTFSFGGGEGVGKDASDFFLSNKKQDALWRPGEETELGEWKFVTSF